MQPEDRGEEERERPARPRRAGGRVAPGHPSRPVANRRDGERDVRARARSSAGTEARAARRGRRASTPIRDSIREQRAQEARVLAEPAEAEHRPDRERDCGRADGRDGGRLEPTREEQPEDERPDEELRDHGGADGGAGDRPAVAPAPGERRLRAARSGEIAPSRIDESTGIEREGERRSSASRRRASSRSVADDRRPARTAVTRRPRRPERQRGEGDERDGEQRRVDEEVVPERRMRSRARRRRRAGTAERPCEDARDACQKMWKSNPKLCPRATPRKAPPTARGSTTNSSSRPTLAGGAAEAARVRRRVGGHGAGNPGSPRTGSKSGSFVARSA